MLTSRAAVGGDVGEARLCGCGVRDGRTRKYMGSHSLLLDETSIVNVHSRYANKTLSLPLDKDTESRRYRFRRYWFVSQAVTPSYVTRL